MRFRERVVLITGGASGIGLAAAKLFAQEGASVVLADINQSAGEAALSQLHEIGAPARFVPVDITNAASVTAMVDTALTNFGRVDSLFHSAGIFEPGRLTDVDEQHWDRQININLKGTFLVLKAVIPVMVAQGGGSIVTTASTAGFAAFPDNPVYIASKAGVLMLSKALARDYGEQGVRINVICPGPVDSPMLMHALAKSGDAAQGRQVLEERTLLKRLATPEEIARVVLFLAGDDASYINGEHILIDAGKLTMNK